MLQLILDWSEAWAPVVALIVVLIYPKQPRYLRPVIIYLIIAFTINLFGDIIGAFRRNFPHWLQTNNYLYNVHSIIRFICFTVFFNLILPQFSRARRVLSILAGIFLLINFIFFEQFFNFMSFSSRLLTVEAALLLLYCLQYYFYRLQDDDPSSRRKPDIWVVTGLCIYVVINFFIFLFYTTLIERNYTQFAMWIWNVHNISYIVLCILLAKAFYDPARS
ncbi:MAG TPA: hypothetical protein VNR87_10380 [Flavisolibacter sp.]|nr:hypothetical protein [Flavisolibacter sp.]